MRTRMIMRLRALIVADERGVELRGWLNSVGRLMRSARHCQSWFLLLLLGPSPLCAAAPTAWLVIDWAQLGTHGMAVASQKPSWPHGG